MNFEEYRSRESERIQANRKRMEEDGVIFQDIYNAYIDDSVVIEEGAFIACNVTLKGNTVIHREAFIGQSSYLENAEIGAGTKVQTSYILDSKVGENTTVGPFAYIRPGSVIGNECKVGDFVEVKNSTVGVGTKLPHLQYIGDSDIGSGVNMGCGTITVNYDGKVKHRTTIEDDAFVGCNSNLVAPVTIGRGSYIAAGSTITKDVPENALGVGRSRQVNIAGWAEKYRNKK